MNFSTTGHEKDDLLLQVTAQAGWTVYTKTILFE